MTTADVAQLYRNQGREVPAEFRVPASSTQCMTCHGMISPSNPCGCENGPFVKRREKYGRTKVTLDGKQFDSSGEAQAWQLLQLWERAGIITDLEVQPEFLLEPKLMIDGKAIRAIKYRADFIFTKDGRRTVVDFKGFPAAAFKIKAKLFKARFPQLVFEIWDRAKVKELSRC